ncbi:hypothetical protein F5884DRAFT_103313 [Xylogone sp. PMI_703]|nr:hypothetical protein F5884DRAFT_103313 [Xylogone sp. PMI_703]
MKNYHHFFPSVSSRSLGWYGYQLHSLTPIGYRNIHLFLIATISFSSSPPCFTSIHPSITHIHHIHTSHPHSHQYITSLVYTIIHSIWIPPPPKATSFSSPGPIDRQGSSATGSSWPVSENYPFDSLSQPRTRTSEVQTITMDQFYDILQGRLTTNKRNRDFDKSLPRQARINAILDELLSGDTEPPQGYSGGKATWKHEIKKLYTITSAVNEFGITYYTVYRRQTPKEVQENKPLVQITQPSTLLLSLSILTSTTWPPPWPRCYFRDSLLILGINWVTLLELNYILAGSITDHGAIL